MKPLFLKINLFPPIGFVPIKLSVRACPGLIRNTEFINRISPFYIIFQKLFGSIINTADLNIDFQIAGRPGNINRSELFRDIFGDVAGSVIHHKRWSYI